ncbi:unnamed protein product [Euphydryas editha]|uniref:Uncharacterized protein n=1 Tax=Euphydryas editha TaxID=104508 RepID=A0AAU9UAE0_EUPED|nr:unnamed protein product [Euphydryas editha]
MKYAALLTLLAAANAIDPIAVDDLRNQFYTLEKVLWKNVIGTEWSTAGVSGDVELTKAFVAFNDQIQLVRLPPRYPFETWLWAKATEKMRIIDGYYENFVTFIRRQAQPGTVPAPVREWLDVADAILFTNSTSSVAQAVRKIHDLLEYGDMFRGILKVGHPDLCDLQMSPHQLIFDMFNTISLTEIKGYAMMQFSWMLLRIYDKGNYTEEAHLTRMRYAERTARIAAAVKASLASADRGLYRCDPPQHKLGETYEEVTRLLQGYIENEVDMNPDQTCKENCAYYTLTESHGCFKEQFCAKQTKCKGRIIDCNYIDSDMWICMAGKNSHRRYEWIEYENGRTLGQAGTCTRGTTKVDSWWRWLFWHCSYCMCLCDEAGPDSHRYFSLWDSTSDVDSWWKWNLLHCSYCFCLCEDDIQSSERFFSLREATADVEKNKVVTGLRLVKYGRVFHLQISEGTLGERGSVTPGSWVPIQKFDISEIGIREGVDYHTLTYERRAIDLDELDSPSLHVLTGVRFRMIGAHLHFEIRSTPFNFTTGRLSPERSQWISNDNTEGAEKPRSRLELYKPDIPTRKVSSLPVDSQHDQYIEFVNSDFDADAAQSTVPFIDIQPVEPMKGAALLSGAGIVHRGARGSGGFLAAKLFTYDYSPHVSALPPPPPEYAPADDLAAVALPADVY